MDNDVLLVQKRAEVYRLFANIFAKEPTVELLRLLQPEENENPLVSYGINPLSDIKHLSLEEQKEALAVEYTQLFLMPKRSCSLHESLQRGEGRLWGESTVEVDRIYRVFGFELDEDFKNTPDHLSAELSFLAELYRLESEYKDKGLEEARKGVLEVKRCFLNSHLLKWFPQFKDKIDKYAKFAYYREITRLLGIMLDEARLGR